MRLSLTLTLSPHDVVLWTDGSVPFPFSKGGSGVLANCSLCGTEATLSFLAGPACSSSSAKAGFGSTNKSATSLLLSDSRSVLAILFSPYFLLSQSLLQIWQELSSLSSCTIRLQWFFGDSLLPGNDAADELARRGALLVPSAMPCSLFSLISRIHSCLFSDWRRTISRKFFDTQVPLISTEELVPLCLRCNGHSLLLSSYLSKIGRIENPSCSACGHLLVPFCTVQLRTLCAARSLVTLYLSATSGPGPGEVPMVFRHTPIPRKGSGNNNNIARLSKPTPHHRRSFP